MKRVLTSQVQLWQLIVITVVLALFATTAAAAAATLSGGFWSPGAVNIAVASGDDTNPISIASGASNVVVLQKSITIPAGKSADLAVLGSTNIEAGTSSGFDYCYGAFRLDNSSGGTEFKPGNYILEGFNPPENNLTVPINGYLPKVPAGTHTVYMVMGASFSSCLSQWRSMIIFANIHLASLQPNSTRNKRTGHATCPLLFRQTALQPPTHHCVEQCASKIAFRGHQP